MGWSAIQEEEECLVKRTNYEAPHLANFSSLTETGCRSGRKMEFVHDTVSWRVLVFAVLNPGDPLVNTLHSLKKRNVCKYTSTEISY
jgi:hypothetical protein